MVYSDNCGPFSKSDVNSEMNLQTYIGYFSHLACTFLMNTKSQTISNILRYKMYMEMRGYGIQTFRTDQWSEYASRENQ